MRLGTGINQAQHISNNARTHQIVLFGLHLPSAVPNRSYLIKGYHLNFLIKPYPAHLSFPNRQTQESMVPYRYGNEHGQPHVAQASTTEAEHSTLRYPSPESPFSQPIVDQQLRPDEDEQQSSSGSQVDLAASQVTYIDSTVTNNTFTFGTSSSVPNITINVTSSPLGRNKRPMASGDEEESSVQSEEPPALSTRSRKRARTGQL